MIMTAALEPLALQGNVKLAAAIIFGIFLGILLVKCEFFDRKKVKENLTLNSMKMIKTLLLALSLGMMAFALLRSTHIVQSNVPVMSFWGVLIGGILVGVGLGIGGLVPVTAVAALASGRLYAFWVLLGMFLAIPAAKYAAKVLPDLISDFSAPVNASLEPGNGIFALNSPVMWLSIITLVLCLFIAALGVKEKE